jgi:ketosteroid isomerase-like protein
MQEEVMPQENARFTRSFISRVSLVTAITVLIVSAGVSAQADETSNRIADTNLRSDLEALHAKWFKAFDSGDGATMDQIEMNQLTLVMPTGLIWAKTTPRAGKQLDRDPQTERALSAVSVRRFGDTAILTGILTTKSAKESSREATTVVFVRSSGKWKIASAQWSPVTEADKTQ